MSGIVDVLKGGAGRLAVVGAIVAGVFAWKHLSGDVSTAKAGDCISDVQAGDASDAKVVPCDSDEAAYRVVGVIENRFTYGEFDRADDACPEYETAESAIFIGEGNKKGDVWCLEILGAEDELMEAVEGDDEE